MRAVSLDARIVVVCRCENVTLADTLEAVDNGIDNLELLKRKLRIGMGPCQGRTCLILAAEIIARRTGRSVEEVLVPPSRPPISPVKIKYFIGGRVE